MIKHLLAVTTLLVAATAHAEPSGTCVTNELDNRQITADLAVAVANCHLTSASNETAGISALEYAHSWFQQAQTLGSIEAREGLKAVEQKLAQAGRAHD